MLTLDQMKAMLKLVLRYPDPVIVCKWCEPDMPCDCEARMTCELAGTPGHLQCGTKPCGCPKFVTCDHSEVNDGPRG